MICVQLRFSLSFSMPRCRYPITTSASTTFSPSSRSTTRSTPCVLGCCGPMFSTSSLVSNIAPRTVPGESRALLNVCLIPCLAQLEPVERVFHQQLAGALERVVLSLRKALPVLRHQDPPAIRVSGEVHAEQIPHLALEPVGRRPHRGGRRNRLVLGHPDLDADPMPQTRRVQTVHDVEPPLGARRPV